MKLSAFLPARRPHAPPAAVPALAADTCFHCELPTESTAFPVAFEGGFRDTCCAGCQAIARAILDNGLGDYDRTRTAAPAPEQSPRQLLDELEVYDMPDVQRSFVRGGHDDVKEARSSPRPACRLRRWSSW